MSTETPVRMVWDNVPEPGPRPPSPQGEKPAEGSAGYPEYVKACRDYNAWLGRARKYELAQALQLLDQAREPEQRQAAVERAVKAVGCMILAGEVGPAPLTSLLDLF